MKKPRTLKKTPGIPKKGGRPSKYTPELAEEICERLANGASMRAISRLNYTPDLRTLQRWVATNESFRCQYAEACEMREDTIFAEILEIADTPLMGIKTTIKASGVETTEGDMVEHRRLQIDARKWVLARMAPKKYGDKIQADLKHEGDIEVRITKNW